jgi:hypothetical protein
LLVFDPIPESKLSVFCGHLLDDGAQTNLTIHGLVFDRLADSELEIHFDGSFLRRGPNPSGLTTGQGHSSFGEDA